jgi:putative peptide zinc metalloprotease protein
VVLDAVSEDLYSPSWYRVAELRPRLRGHVRLHRHHYRGETWYVLEDRVSGRMHRFNPVAHYVIGLMDGRRSVQELWESAAARFGDDAPTQNEMIGMLGQLHAADVLQSEVTPDVAELLRRAQAVRRRSWMQKYLSPLALRIPLFDPDRMLERWLPWYRPLFGWAGLALWAAVVAAGAIGAAMHWSELTEDLSARVLAPGNLLVLALVFPALKALHELGHACATKAWGGEVHEMGVMLLVLMPIPYVDASAATAFRETRRRAVVGAAGMIVEVFVASIAFFVWLNIEPGLARAALYNVMLIAGISTVLFNGNPLLRFDGYYILADLLQIPNLRVRGQRYLSHLVETRVFGVRQAPFEAAPGERAWLAGFTVASFVYRMFVMLAIALFIGTQYFVIGVLLALWVVASSLAWPLARAVTYLAAHPKLRRRRTRAVATSAAFAAAVAALLFAVPFPLWTVAQGITWAPQDAVVLAGSDGFVRKVAAAPGAVVTRGAALLETDDPLLALRIRVLEAQLRLLDIRAHAELQTDRVRWELTKEEMASVRAELSLARERANALTIASPADGVFLLASAQDLPERFVRQGQPVGFVVRPETISLRVLVSQADADLVRSRSQRVRVKLAGSSFETLDAVVRREVPQATHRLPNPALASLGGGVVPVEPRESGAPTAMQGWFEFELELPATRTYAVGERAYVRFEHGWEPLAWRFYRSLRQLFLKHFVV